MDLFIYLCINWKLRNIKPDRKVEGKYNAFIYVERWRILSSGSAIEDALLYGKLIAQVYA